jgi:phage internal scaffolding protein
MFSPNQVAKYGDFSDVASYQDALSVIYQAEDLFSALPSKVRSRFHNDPAELLKWLPEASEADLIDMGFKEKPKPEVETPPPAEVG